MAHYRAEYLWIDGQKPTKKLRSKEKRFECQAKSREEVQFWDIPIWGFDGSSTYQAETSRSDLLLQPVKAIFSPIGDGTDFLVLCEVLNPDRTMHWSNTRARLNEVSQRYAHEKPEGGIEQEYTLFDGARPLGWPDRGFPAPQGGYYCGVGCDEVYGRKLVKAHFNSCLAAGITIAGTNGEVMPAQWEFQVGKLPVLELADELWIARWILYRLGEEFGISAKLAPKPVAGDWNGAGGHCNFSTERMRASDGLKHIEEACERLKKFHKEHIAVYGAHNEERLTGAHETCKITEFRYGVGDRGASIRIPTPVAIAKCGYLEDRRPAANADPYEVLTALLETICGDGFHP